MFDIIKSDLIFSILMKVLIVCLVSGIGIVQKLWVCSIRALRIISAEFGVIRRLWRGSRDHCLLSDSCLVSLNLLECGECRLVAVSVDEHDSFLRKRLFDFLGCFEL